jgi:hypothetical protein
MESISAANVREAVRKNEIRPWPTDFICCAALCTEPFCMCTYLLYWTVWRAFLRKFRFLTMVDDEDRRFVQLSFGGDTKRQGKSSAQ